MSGSTEVGNSADENEPIAHSFIVKIWVEPETPDTEFLKWHGLITHVLSNKRKYLRELNDILAFIRMYVPEVVVEPRLWGRIKRWLKH